MITYDRDSMKIRNRVFSFQGLSSDTKPTDSYENIKILNGSTFLELDTQNVYFYDEENATWRG